MSLKPRVPKVWTGHWLMAVAILHTVVAGALFTDPLLDIARQGLFNSVVPDPFKGQAIWFLLFGAVVALLSVALTALERRGDQRTLRSIGWGTLWLTLLGVVLMPASGFWLAFPPAIALLRRRDAEPTGAGSRRLAGLHDHLISSEESTMFARVMSVQIRADMLEQATKVYRDFVLPVARQQKGFVRALLLSDPATGKAMSLTVWETEADQDAEAANGYIQRELARIGSMMVAPPLREGFEVSVHG